MGGGGLKQAEQACGEEWNRSPLGVGETSDPWVDRGEICGAKKIEGEAEGGIRDCHAPREDTMRALAERGRREAGE